MIIKGSELCEQSENVVKFVVTEVEHEQSTSGSVGSQLSLLCIKCAPVSNGFLLWAKDKCMGNEFPESAAYPTLAPGILSLARIVAKYHPFSRENIVDLASLFLGHSSSEVSPQKLNEIKEQALRLLLIVSTQGLAVNIFQVITRNVKKGIIDPNLIRYFISGALDIIRPPVSMSFIHAFGQLLVSKKCIEALNSQFFQKHKRTLLIELLKSFKTHLSYVKYTGAEKKSIDLISSLHATYDVAS